MIDNALKYVDIVMSNII